jgi:stage V sporulation protein AA
LALGIIVFYNHIFKWKFTEDPTPLQVEMSSYEKDVDDCILDNLSKKGEN